MERNNYLKVAIAGPQEVKESVKVKPDYPTRVVPLIGLLIAILSIAGELAVIFAPLTLDEATITGVFFIAVAFVTIPLWVVSVAFVLVSQRGHTQKTWVTNAANIANITVLFLFPLTLMQLYYNIII